MSKVAPSPCSSSRNRRLSRRRRRFSKTTGSLPRLKALLPSIATPVLVLAGRNDPIVPPPNGELLARHLPHCRHELLEGGHLVWEDAAPAYAARLGEWLRGGYRSV